MKESESDDPNVTAHNVLNEIVRRDALREALDSDAELRRQLMREMGRRGGKNGGKETANRMTPEQRSERARKAGSAPKKKHRLPPQE